MSHERDEADRGGRTHAETAESGRNSVPESEDRVLRDESSDPGAAEQDAPEEAEPDYRDLYLRERADADNFRKRMLKKQTEIVEYASEDLVKRLMPVIDHFQLAIDHGEAGSGVQLAFKELMEALASEGLAEIEVEEGVPFDPAVHHALTTVTDPEASEEVVKQVHRRGWRFKNHVLRAPEVVVAQPAAPGERDE